MYTPIELDKVRNFRYGMRALSLVERKFGRNISKIDFKNLTIKEIMTLLWAGLMHEDRDLTPESLMDILDDNNVKLDTVIKTMGKALQDAFGEGEETEQKKVKAAEE